jgi:chorismate mutase
LARRNPLPREIERLRREIDALNDELAGLLQARARLVAEIGRLKARLGLPAVDARRESEMLARILHKAPEGFANHDLERIFRQVFAASRRLARTAKRDALTR